MNIGKKIIEIRKQRNMTQEDFAKIFHVTRQTVSNWENEKSYPDLQTLVQISNEFDVSLDTMLKEDMLMVKRMDHFKIYKKAFIGLITCILTVGVFAGIYIGVCKMQHNRMYDKVENAGFTKELNEEFIERYQGYYALTENDVDYLVEPKSIGKYELDTGNFVLTARKGDRDITINIDENKNIYLALYPGEIEIDENGNVMNSSKKLTDVQKEHMDNLLNNRKEEILPIINRALELWEILSINKNPFIEGADRK